MEKRNESFHLTQKCVRFSFGTNTLLSYLIPNRFMLIYTQKEEFL